ncbi:MAG: xanthine phosphoribosyltransferase [Clostridiales bacterium]|nr:xanthine phosphoribosyltransferase [Clostridiales bacterium]
MKYLEDLIKEQGEIWPGGIVKVDSFLNHQIDWKLYQEMGKEFYRLFKDDGINKIMTVEASGIGIACVAAQYFKVPMVFAKKYKTSNIDSDLYSAKVHSFTHGNDYNMVVSRKYVNKSDRILLIDDFLANGQALLGLKSIIEQAGATLCGCGIAIEKGFQPGGKLLRDQGIRVESLAIIKSVTDDTIEF